MIKQGELEAKKILMNKGIIFDENYHDDNSKSCMPDLKFSNNSYLEVTHTKHNNKDWHKPNKYSQKPLEDRIKISDDAINACNRLYQDNYERNECYEYTEKGNCERNNDKAKVKSHYGYDFDTNKHTEFECDLKSMSFSMKNVLSEIINDKGKKHTNGNVDLFIFVIKEELHSVINSKDLFLKSAQKSPFKTIYLCVWDMYNDYYEIKNPEIIKINLGVDPPSISNF